MDLVIDKSISKQRSAARPPPKSFVFVVAFPSPEREREQSQNFSFWNGKEMTVGLDDRDSDREILFPSGFVVGGSSGSLGGIGVIFPSPLLLSSSFVG